MARSHQLLATAAFAAVALTTPALAAPAPTSREAESALRSQLDAGRVKAATIYTHRHIVHASLAGGQRYSVRYKAADRKTLVASMLSHHVRFKIVKGAATHHGLRRRYIALIALVIVAALGSLAFVLVRRRRRRAAPAPSAPAA